MSYNRRSLGECNRLTNIDDESRLIDNKTMKRQRNAIPDWRNIVSLKAGEQRLKGGLKSLGRVISRSDTKIIRMISADFVDEGGRGERNFSSVDDVVQSLKRRFIRLSSSSKAKCIDEYREWSRSYIETLQCCTNCLSCMKDKLSVGTKLSLTSLMCRMKSLNVSVTHRFSSRGALARYQYHHAFSIGYYVHCRYDASLCEYQTCSREEGCSIWFATKLYELSCKLQSILDKNVPIHPLSEAQKLDFITATHCHVCEKLFNEWDVKLCDHYHITGEYRGPAHNDCNLNYQCTYAIPVVFHNLSGYDAHFIIKELANAFEGKIDVLPLTKELYTSFTKHVHIENDEVVKRDYRKLIKFRFIDSFKFLSSSLDKLSSYLDKSKMRIVRDEFVNLSDSDFRLLTRKGVFPYDYLTTYEKLNDKQLPSREEFYNQLCASEISDVDYLHAKTVWSRFDIKTLGQYSDLYLKLDVLLLTDVFENFREDCLQNYKLNPTHYYTLPGFAWDVMLKMTKIELELFTDVDMLFFVERGIRGGLSQCSHRYALANNKYLSTYDSSKPSTYLMYFDVNNFYGWAMSQPLPHIDFKWVDDQTFIDNFDVEAIPIDGPVGYIFEVDLEYPREIHDAHADLPFCPTHDTSTETAGSSQRKLLGTLRDKKRYVLHYRYLQQSLRHGLKLKKIYRILQFQQSRWLYSYIDLNTKLRANASNDFSKNLLKLMNNAVFGKTMENVRNRASVKLLSRWNGRYGAERLIARPNFHSCTVFSEDFIAIQLKKTNIKFYKPIYVGMSVLDISKCHLYDFHYGYMYPNFKENCKILYTDTDSLIYEIARTAHSVQKRPFSIKNRRTFGRNEVER